MPHEEDSIERCDREIAEFEAKLRSGQPDIKGCCRYYGMSHVIFKATGRLVTQCGNECALIYTAYSPCKMEMAGCDPDENACPLARFSARAKSTEEPH